MMSVSLKHTTQSSLPTLNSPWVVSVSILMERLLEVFCLPEQFILCGLTLVLFHILGFYFWKRKNCGDRWQWFSILLILIISLDLTNQFISCPVFPAPIKTAFLDNSGCFLTSGACLFLLCFISFPAGQWKMVLPGCCELSRHNFKSYSEEFSYGSYFFSSSAPKI